MAGQEFSIVRFKLKPDVLSAIRHFLIKSLMAFFLIRCCSFVIADDSFWDGESYTDRWLSAQNWVGDTLPQSSDRAILDETDGLILIVSGDDIHIDKILGPVHQTVTTLTMDIRGGSLSNRAYWQFGRVPGGQGVINIYDGQVSTRDFTVGIVGGNAVLNMYGGSLTVNGTDTSGLTIAGDNISTGSIELSGGTITAGNFSINSGGQINIKGGRIYLNGDFKALVEQYISEGLIRAYDGNGLVFCDYSPETDTTIVSGEPISSVGLEFVYIPPGRFTMGSDIDSGEFDEHPSHEVNITKPFYMSTTEVTNAQYEQFDPTHSEFRGKNGFSNGDNEAVLYVSWEDANAFCQWLSQKEDRNYRLPTEAEWEYACRAGTETAYYTGDDLPLEYWKNQQIDWFQLPVSLEVASTPPNPWGLYDMHGNVEEWCYDWYGKYPVGPQNDPLGRINGQFKVTRGGSHGTTLFFLRSANRMGTVPNDKQWMTGFRVVMTNHSLGDPLPETQKPLNMRHVSQEDYQWPPVTDMNQPYFEGPVSFYVPPAEGSYPENWPNSHASTITWCDNGDLLLCWVTNFQWREIYTIASRLRCGNNQWDPASVFFYTPDRDGSGGALINDGNGKVVYMRGISASAKWATLAGMTKWSTNNGADWSKGKLVYPDHWDGRFYHAHFGFVASNGDLVMVGDGGYLDTDGSFIHISQDGGQTWYNPGYGKPEPDYAQGATGGKIAGIHAAVVETEDGSFMAFGRKNNINGMMPKSVSVDKGQSWTYYASVFPGLQGGQRPVMIRLNEGPIVLFSFSNPGIVVEDAIDKERLIFGLFASVSYDEGQTWPVIKPLTTDEQPQKYDGRGRTGIFTMDQAHAEPAGYLGCTQSPDNIIHLVSSGLYYKFNLKWLEEPMAMGDIDDMEFYSPAGAADITSVWQVGGGSNIHIETDDVHWGQQALRLDYDNRVEPRSYAAVSYLPGRNWDRFNIKSLDIWFKGKLTNTPADIFIKLKDAMGREATFTNNDVDQITEQTWDLWRVDLTNLHLSLDNIVSFTIGVGDANGSLPGGGVGTVVFDDIKLYPQRCLSEVELKGDINNDCIVDMSDLLEFSQQFLQDGVLTID